MPKLVARPGHKTAGPSPTQARKKVAPPSQVMNYVVLDQHTGFMILLKTFGLTKDIFRGVLYLLNASAQNYDIFFLPTR